MPYGGGTRGVIGVWGEEQATRFLERQHFVIIERNYHCTTGEIDIIARRGGDYYFVEVKTRSVGELANDLAITPAKIYKLRKAIKQYCYDRQVTEGSFIIAGLLVVYNRASRDVVFRLAPIY